MLALVGALVVGFGGVGWYLGWYKLNVSRTSDGNLQVTTNVDTSRVVKDAGDGARQVGEFIGSQVEKAQKEAANQPTTPASTPGPKAVPAPAESASWLFGIDFGTPAPKK
jgi:hypothetical protein